VVKTKVVWGLSRWWDGLSPAPSASSTDTDGNTPWRRVQDAYPDAGTITRDRPPAAVKDWNQALQQQRERGQEQTPERTKAHESRADERRCIRPPRRLGRPYGHLIRCYY